VTPLLITASSGIGFPEPSAFDDDGLVAIGGEVTPDRLLVAYEMGIFPLYTRDTPPLWWSPNPRAILPLDELHISNSLRRRIQKTDYTVTWNRAFRQVIQACGENRPGGTWILPELVDAYTALHDSGDAFSVEVWMGGELAGGLYGVQKGALFAAESMFHRRTDASKIALAISATALRRAGIELFDVQYWTKHLSRFGVREIPRSEYLRRLAQAQKRRPRLIALDLTRTV
jgi:leucyl/phenylalanyl-tRNA---protein transferase